MLDQFAYCEIERISPEAPAPVLLDRNRRVSLWGARNAARSIATLGGEVVLLGLVGCGHASDELQTLIHGGPRIVNALIKSDARATTCKTRYVAGHQQIMRVDEESTHPIGRK